MARGFTLLESLVAITVAGVVISSMLPAARRSLDRMAVLGARESIVGYIDRARSQAVHRAGAELVVRGASATLTLEAGGVPIDSLNLARTFDVGLVLGGARSETRIGFDGLGIGRWANATIVVRRGTTQATLVVSAYGRVSRR